jgi:hypothetical protein
MSGLPIFVSERVVWRTRLPSLQVLLVMAKRRTKVRLGLLQRARQRGVRLTTVSTN